MTANRPPSATATATEMPDDTAELADGATEVLPAKAPAAKERRS